MAPVPRLPQRDVRPDVRLLRQRVARHERIVERVEHQCGNADVAQVRLGRRALPVIVGVAEAVQRGREDVVELVQVARGAQAALVEQARMLAQLGKRLGLHRAQEHAGVRMAPEAAADRVAAGREIDRRTHRRDRPGLLHGLRPGLLGPAQQHVAAQRDAHGQHRAAAPRRHAGQDPLHLFVVARVIGPRRQVELAGAAAEMRHGVGPALRACETRERLRVAALRGALEAVEQDQQRPDGGLGRRAGRIDQEVDVDEILVGRGPALAVERGRLAHDRAGEQGWPDRLQMSARQPPRGAVRGEGGGRQDGGHRKSSEEKRLARASNRRTCHAVSAAPTACRRSRQRRRVHPGSHDVPPCANPRSSSRRRWWRRSSRCAALPR